MVCVTLWTAPFTSDRAPVCAASAGTGVARGNDGSMSVRVALIWARMRACFSGVQRGRCDMTVPGTRVELEACPRGLGMRNTGFCQLKGSAWPSGRKPDVVAVALVSSMGVMAFLCGW